MNELRNLDLDHVLACAAQGLSRAAGASRHLREPEILSDEQRRNLIVRARAVDGGGHARSVIIKATRSATYDPGSATAFESSGLVREWVATAYLARRAPGRGHGASFLAGDAARGILVYEDLGADLGSLVGPLLKGTAAEAERALVSYAVALGRLHADTIGCADAHAATLESVLGAGSSVQSSGRNFAQLAARVQASIGGSLPLDELAQISRRLASPGAWLGLVHGDPCPDNALVVAGQVRLIDFEFTRPGHALLDAIYWRIGFPTCWCAGRVPPEVAARVDAVYRAEIGSAIPLARDDRAYEAECAYIAAAWLFRSLDWRLGEALGDDKTWGLASIRGRLLWYLEAVVDMTARAGILHEINATAGIWLTELRRRWPTATSLGLYPAFVVRTV